MISFRTAAAALALSLAVVAAASPASAAQKNKSTHAGAANAQAAEGEAGGANGPVMNKACEDALRECSGKSNSFGQTTWGYMQGNMFRTCMAEHGQPE